jgi:hypothetical protein
MTHRRSTARACAYALSSITLASALAAGCTVPREDDATRRVDDEREGTSRSTLLVAAFAPADKIYVRDAAGTNATQHDLESDYLPQVVCCENANAPPITLEAQAIASRTYVYFHVGVGSKGTQAMPFTGTSADGRYYCAQPVTAACMAAVASTRAIVTASRNASTQLVANAGFYVDGPKPACLAGKSCACPKPSPTTSMTPAAHEAGCDCFTWSSNGNANPTYVTYNWNQVGAGVQGSAIGNTGNESNRGCIGQNIQSCLGYAGWSVIDQLRFFYGQDQVLVHTDGSPVVGLDAGAGAGGDAGRGDGPTAPGADSGPSSSGTPGASDGDGGNAADPESAGGGGCSAAAREPMSSSAGFHVLFVIAFALACAKRHRSRRPGAVMR